MKNNNKKQNKKGFLALFGMTSSVFALCTLLVFTACKKDFLDTPANSAMDAETVFSTPGLAQEAIKGVLMSFGETNSYRGRFIAFYGPNSDLELRKSLSADKYGSDDAQSLCTYNTSPGNGQMATDNNAWAKFYEGIERANIAIVSIKKYGDLSDPLMAQILGEFITLRAVLYNDLLKGWGNCVARFEPANEQTISLPRVDRDVVLKQLLADLEEAAELTAWPNAMSVTTKAERINKAFVKGMRARIALTAGGYSQHLSDAPSNELTLSTDPDLAPEKMYAIAKKECVDVILSGTCRLLDYETFWKKFCGEEHKAGEEELWSIPFANDPTKGARGRVLFDLGVPHTNKDKYVDGQAGKGGSTLLNPTLFFDYEKEDVRRDVTCVPWKWADGKKVISADGRDWYIGKFRYEWLSSNMWTNTNTNDDGLNYLYMRYSDILLMAAEAINEIDGPASAAPYLQEVRDRAYPNNPEKVFTYMAQATAGKNAMFKAIVDERALEFAGEMLRKNDLTRWNLLKVKMDDAKAKTQAWASGSDYTSTFNGKTYPYSTLPWDPSADGNHGAYKLYYKTAADGEDIIIYGLNYGDLPVAPDASYTGTKDWNLDNKTYWNWFYYRDPNKQPYWPIWQNFVNLSNGLLNNDGYNMPE
ncbi:MAG: RagB/SusD family nutrient uptake outer membrane protein [Bacteroidales bacterium]|jgi:hypothetical protein|nr:RagB/SusD family nutrient uptake outer membrane protein [Bacteroidales bacterium]